MWYVLLKVEVVYHKSSDFSFDDMTNFAWQYTQWKAADFPVVK